MRTYAISVHTSICYMRYKRACLFMIHITDNCYITCCCLHYLGRRTHRGVLHLRASYDRLACTGSHVINYLYTSYLI